MNERKQTHLSTKNRNFTRPAFFSEQVRDAVYYYRHLTPTPCADIQIVCGGREICRPDYTVCREDFRYYSIEFVSAGRGELLLAGKAYSLRPCTLFCYGPGIPHHITTDAHHPLVKRFVDFTGDRAAELLRKAPFANTPVQIKDPSIIEETFDAIQRSVNADTEQTDAICNLLLEILMLQATESLIAGPAVHERAIQSYQRCRNVIETQHETLQDLDDIANACHLDAAYICRLFKRFGPMSPTRYLQRQKLNRAAELLQHTSLLVKEVSDAMGCSDPFHFSRIFKRTYGISPQRFIEVSRR